MPEQAFSHGSVEAFDNGLVAVNLGKPQPNKCFVVLRLLGNCTHKVTPRIYLQHLGHFKRLRL